MSDDEYYSDEDRAPPARPSSRRLAPSGAPRVSPLLVQQSRSHPPRSLANGDALPVPTLPPGVTIRSPSARKSVAEAQSWTQGAWNAFHKAAEQKAECIESTEREEKVREDEHLKHLHALAKPHIRRVRKFAKPEDARECTFQPRVRSKQGTKERGDFLDEMEVAQKHHRAELERRRAEEAYKARVDKKVCLKCDREQTYAEFAAKKRCEKCGSQFKPRKAWGEVGGSFLTRLQEAEQRKQRAIKALERKIAREKYPFTVPERLVFDPELRKTVTVRPTTKSQRWSEVKGNFLTRMEQDLAKRAETLSRASVRDAEGSRELADEELVG